MNSYKLLVSISPDILNTAELITLGPQWNALVRIGMGYYGRELFWSEYLSISSVVNVDRDIIGVLVWRKK